MQDDGFEQLREVLRQPDRRSLRRHLRRQRREASEGAGVRGAGLRPSVPSVVDELARSDRDGDVPPRRRARREAPDRPAAPAPVEGPSSRRSAWQWVAAVGTGAVLLLGVGALRPRVTTPEARDGRIEPIPTAVSEREGAPAGPPTTTTAAVRLWPAEPVEIDGNEVRTGGHRWQVGEPGDLVTVGDWDCDRLPSPAVLRPATGEVAVFDGWPTEDAVGEARPVGSAPGATAVRPGPRCGSLVVVGADGEEDAVSTMSAAGS